MKNEQEMQIDNSGKAIIPMGTEEINDHAFEDNTQLYCAVLPSTVKKIGIFSFAGCGHLNKLELNEGLETIEYFAFKGCRSLKKLVIPDSVRELAANAFADNSFDENVYSASGDILYLYAENNKETIFTVPQCVKRINRGTFYENILLEEIILPEGLLRIDEWSFRLLNIRRITIPASVQKLEEHAFSSCEKLEMVTLLCDVSAVENCAFYGCPNVQIYSGTERVDFEEELRMTGKSILAISENIRIPNENFWEQEIFINFAKQCATGNTDAMMNFADFFNSLGTEEFYECAANFWRYRALFYGNQKAVQWKKDWLREHPYQFIPTAADITLPHDHGLDHGQKGKIFHYLGFLFFEPDRTYTVREPDEKDVVMVMSVCDHEAPDIHGLLKYDCWFLDEHFNVLPGVSMLHSLSRRMYDEDILLVEHHAAAMAIQQRRSSYVYHFREDEKPYTTYKVSRSGAQVVFEKAKLPEGAKYVGEGFKLAGEKIVSFFIKEDESFVMGEAFEAEGTIYYNYPDYMDRPTAAGSFVNTEYITRAIIFR